jgi:nitroreductase
MTRRAILLTQSLVTLNPMTEQDTYRRIIKLRAVRVFRNEQLSDVDLDAIIEAARWTGSSKNNQNWKFIVIRDSDQKDRLLEAGSFMTPVKNAPCVIALVDLSEGYEFDIGRAAQNIMLAADAIGVASCPVTLHNGAAAAEVLGLPEGTRARYAVALGYPTGEPPTKRKFGAGGRKSRDEVVSYERFPSPQGEVPRSAARRKGSLG